MLTFCVGKAALSLVKRIPKLAGKMIISRRPPLSRILSMTVHLRSEDKGLPGRYEWLLLLTSHSFTCHNTPFPKITFSFPRGNICIFLCNAINQLLQQMRRLRWFFTLTQPESAVCSKQRFLIMISALFSPQMLQNLMVVPLWYPGWFHNLLCEMIWRAIA